MKEGIRKKRGIEIETGKEKKENRKKERKRKKEAHLRAPESDLDLVIRLWTFLIIFSKTKAYKFKHRSRIRASPIELSFFF